MITEKNGEYCHVMPDGSEMCHPSRAEAEAHIATLHFGDEKMKMTSRALKGSRSQGLRTETYQGREHLVVPVVALVEGVIHASNADTPELVLAEEFEKNVAGWNGRPVMLNHPTWGDGPVAANDPRVLDANQIGTVFHARVEDGKLKMDAYVDPVRLEGMGEHGQKMLASIRAGEMLEVSVGTVVEATPENGKKGGQPYAAVWRDISSDHLAFLPPGVKGACSVAMGCGAPRAAGDARAEQKEKDSARAASCGCGGQGSHNASAGERSMEKKARIAAIIASGKTCFKAADAAVLEQLSDEAITDMETKLAAFPPAKKLTPEEEAAAEEAKKKAMYASLFQDNPELKLLIEESKLTPEARREKFLKDNPDIGEIVTKNRAAAASRRVELVGKLKVAQAAYSETELQALSNDQLEKIALIALKAKPSYEGAGAPREAAQNNDDEVPAPPSMSQQVREARKKSAN
jgi:hypothetical protein